MGDRGGQGMNLEEEIREELVAQSERRETPPVDLAGLMAHADSRRRHRTPLRLAVAAAVVAILGGGAFWFTQDIRTLPEPAAPLPSDAPSSVEVAPILSDSTCPERCLEPGTYAVRVADRGKLLGGEVTVEADGWESVRYLHRVSRSGPGGAVMLNVYEPLAFASRRPCVNETALAPDATVDDVARRLAYLPQFEVVEGPTAVPAFGHETLHLRIQADRIRCSEALDPDPDTHAQYNLADIAGVIGDWSGDSDIDPGQPVLIDLWVLELEGHNIVVEARQEGSPTNEMIEQLDQVRTSLEFVAQE
jgi:hypothetical protein